MAARQFYLNLKSLDSVSDGYTAVPPFSPTPLSLHVYLLLLSTRVSNTRLSVFSVPSLCLHYGFENAGTRGLMA